jgi:glycosyltransferase involved in cell wall biosynthesis
VTFPTKRILYVITDLKLGGVPLHLRRLVGAMRARGFQAGVASLGELGEVARMLVDDGVEVHGCGGRGRWDVRVVHRLARIIRQTQPDILHAFLFHANLASRVAAHITHFPKGGVLCEIQTVEVERKWHLLVDRLTHRACRLTIGNSPSVIEHLHNNARIPRDRLRLVRGGIDPAPLAAATPTDRSTLGLDPDTPIVLWAGRLDPVKGLDILIRAFAILAKESNAHLLWAGDGPLRQRLSKLIEHEGLTSRVHLLGARRDIPSLLKAADVFAFPSRTEGLPNALLEAMAAGCPIVTTNVPGCRDLITHESTGLLVPYGDTLALAGALARLLRDRGEARRLGARAAQEVTRSWHIDGTHAAYAAFYDEVPTAP